MTTTEHADIDVADLAGDLCTLPPLDLCSEPSPKGKWRCIRAPHDSDNHVYAGEAPAS